MNNFRVFLLASLATFLTFAANPVLAKATCFCSVSCSLGDGSSYNPSTHWAKRPGGSNFNFPLSNNEKNECQNYCADHVQGLDLEAVSEERGICGNYSCKGTSRIGPPKPGRDIGTTTRSSTVDCPPPACDPSVEDCTENQDSIVEYQYSSKIVCGTPEKERVVLPGVYQSAVNVHNPQYEAVTFRRKVAVADLARDGKVSKFIHGEIGPDAAQVFDCNSFNEQAKPSSSLTDGYFVIESKAPLDVTTYYTAGDKENLQSVDVERTFEREVPGKEWLCDGGNSVSLDLSDPDNWVTPDGNPAYSVTDVFNSWDQNRSWVSFSTDGQYREKTESRLQLPVCVCSTKTKAKVTIGSARVDDSLKMYFLPNASNASNQTSPGLPLGHLFLGLNHTSTLPLHTGLSLNASLSLGNNTLVVDIKNETGPTGMSLENAMLSIDDAYLGNCRH